MDMEQRTCKRMLTPVLIVLFILTSLDMDRTSANPIPYYFFEDSKSGGSPAPCNASNEVYFSKEWVFADIEETAAKVTAHYTFRNTGSVDAELPICLPFHERSWNITILQGEAPLEFTGWDIQGIAEAYRNDRELYQLLYGADWITFNVSVPARASKMVTARYWSKVSVDARDPYHNRRMFSYLVGSACLWNHSLDHAFFEFRMHTALFDEKTVDVSLLNWDQKEMDGYFIFTQEFYDWTPEGYDYIQLSWDTDNSSSMGHRSFLSSPFFYVPLGMTVIAVILGSIAIVALHRRRKTKKENGR